MLKFRESGRLKLYYWEKSYRITINGSMITDIIYLESKITEELADKILRSYSSVYYLGATDQNEKIRELINA